MRAAALWRDSLPRLTALRVHAWDAAAAGGLVAPAAAGGRHRHMVSSADAQQQQCTAVSRQCRTDRSSWPAPWPQAAQGSAAAGTAGCTTRSPKAAFAQDDRGAVAIHFHVHPLPGSRRQQLLPLLCCAGSQHRRHHSCRGRHHARLDAGCAACERAARVAAWRGRGRVVAPARPAGEQKRWWWVGGGSGGGWMGAAAGSPTPSAAPCPLLPECLAGGAAQRAPDGRGPSNPSTHSAACGWMGATRADRCRLLSSGGEVGRALLSPTGPSTTLGPCPSRMGISEGRFLCDMIAALGRCTEKPRSQRGWAFSRRRHAAAQRCASG